jgi:hypothetical protein
MNKPANAAAQRTNMLTSADAIAKAKVSHL